MLLCLGLMGSLVLCGCWPHPEPEKVVPASTEVETFTIPPDASPWEIASTQIDPQWHAYLGNGYLGFMAGPLGGGEGPGESGACFVAGDYKNDALERQPSPAKFFVSLGHEVLSGQSTITDYRQVLQMHDGTLDTRFNWSISGKSIPIKVTTFASRADPHLVVVHVTTPRMEDLRVQGPGPDERTGEYKGPPPPGTPMHLSNSGGGAPMVVMTSSSDDKPAAGAATDATEWTGYTAIETSDDGPDPRKLAADRLKAVPPGSYEKILAEHVAAWHALWQSDITIEGDPASQQMVHAALFYLLESTRKGSRWSIPPMGLSNDTWGGHIFWDAPMWMFPALVLLHPDEARPMVDYAARMLPQAKALAQKGGQKGASYPWESARSGGESAAEPYAQERHVTSDTANMAWRYYLYTHDRKWLKETGYPLLEATANYWTSRMTEGADASQHIRKVVGPDETAGIVDDDCFTNGVVKVNLQDAAAAAEELGLSPPPAWKEQAARLLLPFDSGRGIYLPHAGYKDQKLKQADPELLIYPLGLVTDLAVIGKMLAFYPSHISTGGPAMTDSIYATIAARQGNPDDAMKFFRHSYEPFLTPSFDQISEKHSHQRQYCFVTGLGGLVQSVIYGFGGLTLEGEKLQPHPHLPAAWKKLTISGIHFRGHVYNLDASGSNVIGWK